MMTIWHAPDRRKHRHLVTPSLKAAVAGIVVLAAAVGAPATASARSSGSTTGLPYSSALAAVSCPTSTFCMAVGNVHPTSTTDQTLAETWNGSSWKIVSTPAIPNTEDRFNGVSCRSATVCFAVGTDPSDGSGDGPSPSGTLIETWNGTSWRLQTAPNDLGPVLANLRSVSCSAVDSCKAVGWTETGGEFPSASPLTEEWNGKTWTDQPPRQDDESGQLSADHCASSSFCVAVGGIGNETTAFAEQWTGTSWIDRPTPAIHDSTELGLYGAACPSLTWCMAVGSQVVSNHNNSLLTERWNGTSWQIVPILSQPGQQLNAVSCASPSYCEAVGIRSGSSSDLDLTERWNGSTWTSQSTPSQPGGSSLAGISCTSPDFCMAVGAFFSDVWNGTTWTIHAVQKAYPSLPE